MGTMVAKGDFLLFLQYTLNRVISQLFSHSQAISSQRRMVFYFAPLSYDKYMAGVSTNRSFYE